MAENKKSVLLYCDLIHTVEGLNDKEAGRLFKHYLRYINDLDPVAPDRVTKITFEPIKQALKRDLKKWESIVEKRSLAGQASAEKRKQIKQVLTSVERAEQGPTNPTVTESVNDNVTVNVKEINSAAPLFRIEECLTVAMNDPRWVDANKVKKSDLETFNKMLEGRGVYEKNPLDYKTHYYNWNKGGRKNETPVIGLKDQNEYEQKIAILREAKAKTQ